MATSSLWKVLSAWFLFRAYFLFCTLGSNGSGFHFLFFQLSSGLFLISGFLISETACTGLCNRRGSKTLEMAHPEKPTPSGFRAKNYKMRLGWNVLILLNPKFQVDWSTTSWDIHHWFGSRNFVFVLILHLILLFFSSNFTRSGSVSSLGLPQSAYLVLLH